MARNQTLTHRSLVKSLIEAPPIKRFFEKLKDKKHRVFTELHELSGVEYQEKLAELK